MKTIALVAPKQYGKTTAADYLVDKYGFTKIGFKDALIEEIKKNFPDLLEAIRVNYYGFNKQTVDDLFNEKQPLIRALMQNYGTEVRRGDDPEYWTKRWQAQVEIERRAERSVVCDDARFLNEAQTIRDQDGLLIRIERTDMTNTDSHSSEQEQYQIQCDHTITCNGGDIEYLYAELDAIIKGNDT